MPSTVRCPFCGQAVQALDAKHGKCIACGEVFGLPNTPTKVCCTCGKDVSGMKRVKDRAGNYY